MAQNISFHELYRGDTRFVRAVEDLLQKATLIALGLDGQMIVEAYDHQSGHLDITEAGLGGVVQLARVVDLDNEVAGPRPVDEDVPNVVEDLGGKAATEKVAELAADGEVGFLAAVRDKDKRSSVAMQAARALFDLRSQ